MDSSHFENRKSEQLNDVSNGGTVVDRFRQPLSSIWHDQCRRTNQILHLEVCTFSMQCHVKVMKEHNSLIIPPCWLTHCCRQNLVSVIHCISLRHVTALNYKVTLIEPILNFLNEKNVCRIHQFNASNLAILLFCISFIWAAASSADAGASNNIRLIEYGLTWFHQRCQCSLTSHQASTLALCIKDNIGQEVVVDLQGGWRHPVVLLCNVQTVVIRKAWR